MEWNTIKYIDCMDENEGLPSLEDKIIDSGYTDPPWGSKYKNKKETLINYNDDWRPQWNLKWFKELERVCKSIILVIPQKRMIWWIQNTNPIGVFIVYHKSTIYPSKISKFNYFTPYLIYGKLPQKLHCNVRKLDPKRGFLSHDCKEYIHPSPKGLDIALLILKEIKPKTMIDPFAGSGSYLKAADILGIKWLGYELNSIYKQDIDKRFSQKGILKYCS